MPSGKLSQGFITIVGGVPTPESGRLLKSMQEYVKSDHGIPEDTLKTLSDTLDLKFKIYHAHHYAPLWTPTQYRKEISRVLKAAVNLEKDRSNIEKREKLYATLYSAGEVILDDLNKAILRRLENNGVDKRECNYGNLFSALRDRTLPGYPDPLQSQLPALRALASITSRQMAPGRAKFPDPSLANLVLNVAPIWEKVTGRTSLPVSADHIGDNKIHLFGEWLGAALVALGLEQPPVGRIQDASRFAREAWESGDIDA